MKKSIIIIIITLSAFVAQACDICGCGVGSYYIGILPEYNKRFAGLRYQHKSIQTHLGPNGNVTPLTTDEIYQSAEFWAGINFGSKFRALAFIPYNFNQRSSQGDKGSKNGLGDIAFMGYYNVFNKSGAISNKLIVQSLWMGLGLKLPTGAYTVTEQNASIENPNNFQLGTASTDFTLNAAYDIRLNDLGVNTNVNYKMNTENKYGYRYGNKLSLNVLIYHKFRVMHQITLAPNLGLSYETAQRDVEYNKFEIATSGGYATAAIAGVEIATKKISIGANYQNVVSQNLADKRAKAGDKIMIHLSIPF